MSLTSPQSPGNTPNANQIVSPESTGGGGVSFERLVSACYLVPLLLGAVPRRQEAGLTQRIKLQRFFENEYLDDLIIFSEVEGGEGKLSLQIKQDLTFGLAGKPDKNPFEDVMRACWNTFQKADFSPALHHFGIALGDYKAKYDAYQAALSWARNSDSAEDFFSRISTRRLSSADHREIVDLTRAKLASFNGGSVDEDVVWRFLRSFVILHFDLKSTSSRDKSHALALLQTLLPAGRDGEAPRLWDALLRHVAEGHPAAASFDATSLRQLLQSDGFHADEGLQVAVPASCRVELKKLHEEAGFILRDIQSDIAGLELSRVQVLEAACEQARQSPFLLLTGPPGAGKSNILKAMAQAAQGEGPAIVLSWDRLRGPGWNGMARHLNLQRELREILVALSGATQPTVFLDGIDRILDDGSQKAVNDLLRELEQLPLSQDGSRRWAVVATARQENVRSLYGWLDRSARSRIEMLPVPELEEEEVRLVAEANPRLLPLLPLAPLRPILRNPFLFSLIADPRVTPLDEPLPPVATEIEVAQLWWLRVVGLERGSQSQRAQGTERKQALLALGQRAVRAPGRWLSITDVDATALQSLSEEGILLLDAATDRLRVRRDPLEEWVLYRVLYARREEMASFLRELGEPLGLSRSMQLLGAFLLEHEDTPDEWSRLLRDLEGQPDLSPRWRQSLLTAPLISTRALDLLDKAAPVLLENEAARLVEILVALRTVEVEPNLALAPVLADEAPHERDAILMSRPLPRLLVWFRLLQWLVPRLDELPESARPEAARVLEMWQRNTAGWGEKALRKEIAEVAFRWLEPLQEWRDEDDEDAFEDDPDWD